MYKSFCLSKILQSIGKMPPGPNDFLCCSTLRCHWERLSHRQFAGPVSRSYNTSTGGTEAQLERSIALGNNSKNKTDKLMTKKTPRQITADLQPVSHLTHHCSWLDPSCRMSGNSGNNMTISYRLLAQIENYESI